MTKLSSVMVIAEAAERWDTNVQTIKSRIFQLNKSPEQLRIYEGLGWIKQSNTTWLLTTEIMNYWFPKQVTFDVLAYLQQSAHVHEAHYLENHLVAFSVVKTKNERDKLALKWHSHLTIMLEHDDINHGEPIPVHAIMEREQLLELPIKSLALLKFEHFQRQVELTEKQPVRYIQAVLGKTENLHNAIPQNTVLANTPEYFTLEEVFEQL